jgi:hypothetical protein
MGFFATPSFVIRKEFATVGGFGSLRQYAIELPVNTAMAATKPMRRK